MSTSTDEGPENIPAPDGELSRERVDRDHLTGIERTYIYTAENLVRLLGLQGDEVVKVAFDTGVWHLTTREKIK